MFLFRALASGSSGNAYLLRTGKVSLLFEAGVRLSTLNRYLAAEGVTPESLDGVLVSHEHRDHCSAALELAELHGTSVWANAQVLAATGLHGLPGARVLDTDRPVRFGDVEVRCFPVPHDAVAPIGFFIRACGRSITIATDAGEPTDDIREAVSQSDLVVLESNHDTRMLAESRYPYHLRRRVAGPTGHLSNTQAAAVLSQAVQSESTDVWLAHLSKQNNAPALARNEVRSSLMAAGLSKVSVEIAQRDRPSLRWNGEPRPRQLSLFEQPGGSIA